MGRRKGVQPDLAKRAKKKSAWDFRPMLAFAYPYGYVVPYPLYVSPKFDGIRCCIRNDEAVTRKLKPIPNKAIYNHLSHPRYDGLDGELIVGHPCALDCWNQTTSGVMSVEGEPAWAYYVFDDTTTYGGYDERAFRVQRRLEELNDPKLILVPQYRVMNEGEMMAKESEIVAEGYEGIILRKADSNYYRGRASLQNWSLVKLKRFVDAEAYVVGMTELMHNENPPKLNALGLTERSTHKDNKVGAGKMGTLICHFVPAEVELAGKYEPVEFELGTGFTDEMRVDMWKNSPVGKLVKFRFQRLTIAGKPLFPSFLGMRHEDDMS